MDKIRKGMTPKKIFISATSLVLVFALLITALCMAAPDKDLKVSASTVGTLTSVSGNNIIPDTYEAVNVPAGTWTMTAENYGTPVKSDGVAAFDFHIFAEKFASTAHTCGNIAVDYLGAEVLGNTGAPEFGSRNNHDTLSVKLSYIGDTTGWSSSTNPEHMTLVFGEYNKDGVPNSVTAEGQVHLQSNGKDFLMGNGKKLTDNIYIDKESDGKPFINITDELTEAENYQRYLVWLADQIQAKSTYTPGWGNATTINVGDDKVEARVLTYNDLAGWGWGWNGTTIDFSKYEEDTIIVDFDTYYNQGGFWSWPGWASNANSLITGKVTIKGTAGKRIIFNVDTTNLPGDSINFMNIEMSVDGIKNSEDAVDKDNNVLWNFYQKNDSTVPNSTTGTVSLSGTWVGTVLAPDAVVKCDAGLNGSIIAKEVTTSAETHKSDYTGEKVELTANGKTSLTLTKKWDDDPNTRPQYISIKLLRDDSPFKTVQISADDVAVSDNGNTWTYTFDNLEATDRAGKYYRYSVEEIVPAGYTATIFNNTIINVGGKTEPVYGSIVVKKKAEGAGETPLAGAQFKLTSNGGLNLSGAIVENAENVVKTDNAITWTSTGEAFAKISNLPYGDYTVTEIGAPAGYVMEANGKNVKVDKAETSVDFINKPTKVKIAKLTEGGTMLPEATLTISSVYGTDLSGVEVEGCTLVNNDGKTITIKTTGHEINLKKLPVGSYTLTETEAPEGYDIAAPISFTVNDQGKLVDGNWNTITRVNMTDKETPEVIPEPVYRNIYIDKKNGNSGLSGAYLELSSVTGLDMSTVKVNYNTPEQVKDANGKVTAVRWTSNGSALYIEQLLEGTYILKEITPPAGYKPAAPITIEANEANANKTFTMQDEIIEMNISKKDLNSGAELKGATLKLTSTTGANLSGVVVDVDGYTANQNEVIWTTDGEAAKLSKLPAGTYTLSETKYPAGYKQAADITFTVDAYGNVSGTNVSGSTVTMYDEPVKVYIGKQYNNNGATGKLAGAKLQLTGVANGNKIDLSAVSGTINVEHPYPTVVTWTSAAAPNELRGLPDGTYTLHEIEAPEGYELSDDIELVIENGVIKSANEISVDEGGNTVRKAVAITGSTEGKSDTVTMTDNKAQFYSLVLSKLDADKYLAETPEVEFVGGAKLAVFPADAVSYAAENAVIIVDTVDGVASKVMLPDGEYVLVELDAPDEYTKTNNKAYFTVNNGTLEVKSLNADELAVATTGNPKDAGLAVDAPDSYYTLETSGIFDQYGAYPSTISFALDEGTTEQYICSSFILYKEGPNGAVEVVKITDDTLENPESSWNFTVGNNVANAYEPGYTYYAVITMKDTSGKIVRGDELGSLHLKLNYPLITSTGTQQTNTVKGTEFTKQKIVLEDQLPPKSITLKFTDATTNEPYPVYLKQNLTLVLETDTGIGITRWNFNDANNTYTEKTLKIEDNQDGLTYEQVKAKFEEQIKNNPNVQFVLRCDSYDVSEQNGTSLKEKVNTTMYVDTGVVSGGTEEGDAPNVGEAFEEQLGSLGGGMDSTVGNALKNEYYESVDGVTAYVVLPNYKTPEKYDHAFSVKLTKVDENGTTITSDTASFLLLDNDGNLVTNLVKTADGVYEYSASATADTMVNTDAKPLVTAADGTLVVNKLNEGAYSFIEVKAPANYELYDGEITFVLNLNHISNNPKQVKAVNTKKTGSFAILKNDDAGKPVEGATFKIYQIAPNSIYNPVAVKNEKGEDMIFTTGNDGKVTATGLELGYFYYAVEQSAPDGYTADKETKYPQLADDQRYYINNSTELKYGVFLGENSNVKTQVLEGADENGNGGTWTDKSAVDENGNAVTMLIDAATATIGNDATRTTFKKIDSETKQPLAGAKFKLTLKNAGADAKLDFVTANVISERTVNYVDENGNPVTVNGKTSDTEEVFAPVGLEHYHGKDADGNYEEYIIWTSTEDAQGVTLLGLPASAQYTIEEIEAPYGYEKADLSGKTVTVGTVHDAYENSKLYGSVTLTKADSVTFKALPNATFKLQQLVDGEWVDYKTDLKTDANGQITETRLPYGGTFKFVETEAPDGYKADQTETEGFTIDGETAAECTFDVYATNTAKGSTQAVIQGTKKMADGSTKPLAAGDYQFALYAKGSDEVIETVSNNADGSFTFSALTFEKSGTYEYVVKEVNAGQTINGVTYDNTEYNVVVTVKDDKKSDNLVATVKYNGGDAMTFENSYTAKKTSVQLKGTKTLQGARSLAADEFSFTLAGDGIKTQTKYNDANGKFTFDAIEFTQTGTYTYTISEVKGSIAGVTYTDKTYTVTVEVTDEGYDGQLDATIKLDGAIVAEDEFNAAFTNTYKAAETGITLKGTKTVNNTNGSYSLKENDFSFTLSGEGVNETVQNASDGSFTFSELTFDTADTYNYTITEAKGNIAGMTYSEKTYNVEIVVTDSGNGQLSAEIKLDGTPVDEADFNAAFENTYTATGTEITLTGTKTLTKVNGTREIRDGEFSFTLAGDNIEAKTVSNGTGGAISFGNLTFNKVGTYNYTITEVEGTVPGVTYNAKTYNLMVEVTDENGQLTAKTFVDGTETTNLNFAFQNTYEAAPANVVLKGTKNLVNTNGTYTLKANDFSFTLAGDGIEAKTVQNDADGNFAFEQLTFNNVGTYNYTITEVDGGKDYITYDTTPRTVTIVVSDNGSGKLTATVNDNRPEDIVFSFENTYTPTPVIAQLTAAKNLVGSTLDAGEYSFVLKDSEGNMVGDPVSNAEGGSITFDEITFDKVGTYTYTVTEVIPEPKAPGVTYDTRTFTWTVEVNDDQDGKLTKTEKITVNGEEVDEIVFVNKYETGTANVYLKAQKNLEGRQLKASEFKFNLTGNGETYSGENTADGEVVFPALTFSQADAGKEFTYTISEVDEGKSYFTYDPTVYNVTVKVIDNGDATLSAKVFYNDAEVPATAYTSTFVFNNDYITEGTGAQLTGNKVMSGGKPIIANQYSFTITDVTAEDSEYTETVWNDGDGKFEFTEIQYTQADIGKTFTYEVEENNTGVSGVTYDTTKYTWTVEIIDNGDGTISAVKKLDGTLNGTPVFTNTYGTTDTKVKIEASKVLNGRDLNANDRFEFTLTGGNAESTVTKTAYNDADGKVSFDEITYSKAGLYTYTITEVVPEDTAKLPGVTYNKDGVSYGVLVRVEDENYDGVFETTVTYTNRLTSSEAENGAEFVNTYDAEDITAQLGGTKTLDGRDIVNGEFTFTLTGGNENKQSNLTAAAGTDGKFTFPEISYDKAGTYVYTIAEKIPENAENNKYQGVTYDTKTYTWTVVVTDNTAAGKLEKTETLEGGNAVVFENTYETGKATAQLKGDKDLTVDTAINSTRPIKVGEFAFTITDVTDEDSTYTETVYNTNTAGAFEFSAIEYTQADIGNTYTYKVKEVNAGQKINGITYDSAELTWIVNVKDNGDGTIRTEAKLDGVANGEAKFTNTYTAAPAKAQVGGKKVLEGKALEALNYRFELLDEDGNLVKQAVNAAPADGEDFGTFQFEELSFTAVGTYTYTIKEVVHEDAVDNKYNGVTYDTTEYTWTVTVTDPGNGQLTASAVLSADEAVFVNTYETTGTTYAVEGTKTFTGRELKENEFTFTLTGGRTDIGGNVIEAEKISLTTSALNATETDGEYTFKFDAIEYTQAGTYKYTVEEVIPTDRKGVTYDTTKHIVTVRVYDGGSGKLVAAGPENILDELTFENSYEAQEAKIDVDGLKRLDKGSVADRTFKFHLLDGDTIVHEATASENGNFTFKNITFEEVGTYTYTIKEVNTAEKNVAYDGSEYTLTVVVTDEGFDGQLDAVKTLTKNGTAAAGLVFTNEVVSSDINLIKKDAVNEEVLKGAKLELEALGNVDLSGVELNGATRSEDGKKITWESDETAQTLGAVPNGIYKFTETTAPNGYEIAEVIHISIEGDEIKWTKNYTGDTTEWTIAGDGTVVMLDAPNDLTLSKKEFAAGPELPGAVLKLEPVTDIDLSTVIIPEDVSYTDDNIITWKSDETEKKIGRIPDGIYKFTEITAPDGYEVAEVIYIKVSASDIYSVTESEYSETEKVEWTEAEGDRVIMLDAPKTLTISKKDAVNKEELPGAVIELKPVGFTADFSKVRVIGGEKSTTTGGVIRWTSTEEETKLERLPDGLYTLEETTAPSGYEKTEKVYVKVEGSKIYSGTSETTLTETTSETVVMFDEHNKLVLSKEIFGTDNGLPGAMLTLEAVASTTDLSQIDLSGTDAVYTEATNSISWVSTDKPTVFGYLPNGEYKFIENIAPTGYATAEFIYIRISGGDVSWAPSNGTTLNYALVSDDKVVMEDKPNKVVLSKMAFGGNSELPGAELKLEAVGSGADLTKITDSEVSNTDGVLTWTSGSKAIEIDMIPNGVYKFTETTAPQGYQIAEVIYVKVDNGVIYSVVESAYNGYNTDWGTANTDDKVIMYDHPVVIPKTANVSFVKYSNINKILPGATFQLAGSNGINKTATSGADGVVLFTAIPEGEYVIAETKSPAGYNKSTNSVTVKVDSEGVASYFGPNGNAIEVMGIEQLMKNEIIPMDDEKTLKVGDIVDLTDDLIKEIGDLKGETITWQTSDPSIATVDQNGKATILKPGKVTINAYKDGVLVGTFVLGASEQAPVQQPSTNNTPNTGETESPKTGDDNNNIIAINIGLVSLAVALITGRAIYNRKKRRETAEAED